MISDSTQKKLRRYKIGGKEMEEFDTDADFEGKICSMFSRAEVYL